MLRSIHFLKGFSKKRRFKSTVFLSVLLFLIVTVLIIIPKKEPSVPGKQYQPFILEYSEKYGIEPSLVFAVIECESNFNEKAISPAGASGLMQLMPETFDWILPSPIDGEKRDVFSPQQNIEAGCKYLSYLLRRFKVTETVLAAYNAGEGTVSLWLKTPEYSADGINLKEIPYSETRLYVGKVMRRAEFYENMLK